MSIHLEALLGPAGCGKSYELQQRIKEDINYAILTATTGVAAVNLGEGVTTINSLLKFFDLPSLKVAYEGGFLTKRFVDLARRGVHHVAIDEISMFSAAHLDIIHQAAVNAAKTIELMNIEIEETNASIDKMAAERRQSDIETLRRKGASELQIQLKINEPLETAIKDPKHGKMMYKKPTLNPVGLIVTGDFLQLPPVDGLYAFHAQSWKEGFSKNVKKMTGSYRQDNPKFLEALNLARRGRGVDCSIELKKLGVKFVPDVDRHFDGTTLFPTNMSVDKLNRERLAEMPGEEYTFYSRHWGKQRGEWDKEIPTEIKLKVGALVMVLINQPKTFNFVNGDLATVVSQGVLHQTYWEANEISGKKYPVDVQTDVLIEDDGRLLPVIVRRKNYGVAIPRAISKNMQTNCPTEQELASWNVDGLREYKGPEFNQFTQEDPEFWAQYYEWIEGNEMGNCCYFDPVSKAWVVGENEHLPIRLGYAMTIHKCQGLTLDNVQIDARSIMAGKPGLMYVALSRCRRPEGITIVGSPYVLAKRINTSAEVGEWI